METPGYEKNTNKATQKKKKRKEKEKKITRRIHETKDRDGERKNDVDDKRERTVTHTGVSLW